MGRAREPYIDDAVLRATRDLLLERGYAGTSVTAKPIVPEPLARRCVDGGDADST